MAGLVAWIHDNAVTAIVDATHPFASQMPFHAAEAAKLFGIPLLALTRPAWKHEVGDDWLEVATHAQAMDSRPPSARIFLTVGRLEIDAYTNAPEHFYLVRTIDEVAPKSLPNAEWITRRGPFTVEGEQALMREHRIDTLITKNSGGGATYAKLIAARDLGLKVILVSRPPKPDVERVMSAEAALEWITRKI